MVQPDGPNMTMKCGAEKMQFAFWVGKARIQTHSQYLMIISFPRHQWLREDATLLCHSFIACIIDFLPLIT